MICFFIGHRDAEMQIMPQLEAAICQHITEYGVTKFVVGQYGAFDRMAASAVLKVKNNYPNISLTVLLPYHPSEREIHAPLGYDQTFYPPGMEFVPRRFAIDRANRYMLKHCHYLIAYAWHPASNTKRFVELARRRADLTITELSRPSTYE